MYDKLIYCQLGNEIHWVRHIWFGRKFNYKELQILKQAKREIEEFCFTRNLSVQLRPNSFLFYFESKLSSSWKHIYILQCSSLFIAR